MKNFPEKFISIFLAAAFLVVFQGAASSFVKADFSDEIAADLESSEDKDSSDQKLKLGNFSEEKIFIASHKIQLSFSFKNSSAVDFSSSVPTSPPNV